MKCPYCSKEIKDDAAFCGFCGKQVPLTHLKEASPSPPSDEVKNEVSESFDNTPSETVEETRKKPRDKPKKKRTALKVLLIFVLLAFVGGSVLGFLTARGVISIESLLSNSNFKWTSFSEAQSETTETDETSDDKENEKGESSGNSSPNDEEADTSPSTETTDSSSETGEGRQPTASNSMIFVD